MNKMEEFIKSYPTKKTQDTYKTVLKKYFEIIQAKPETYFEKQRDYEEDIKKFWYDYLINKTPCTRTSYSACVNVFLEENNIDIPKKTWKQLKRKLKGSYPVTIDTIPTATELKQILSHGEIKAKALFLIAISSGMRINEILQLTEQDINLKTSPATIYVRAEYTKLKQPRITFISDEAKTYLVEWQKNRDKYLESSVRKIRGICTKSKDDNTIFCFGYTLASKMWNRLLNNSGYNAVDPTTKYHIMHIHTLRKYFKTTMIHAGIQEAIVNQLVGHTGYLDNSYLRFTEKDLADGYMKGMHLLSVFEVRPDLTGLNKKLETLESENNTLKENLKIMQLHLESLENKLDNQDIRKELEKIKNGKN